MGSSAQLCEVDVLQQIIHSFSAVLSGQSGKFVMKREVSNILALWVGLYDYIYGQSHTECL